MIHEQFHIFFFGAEACKFSHFSVGIMYNTRTTCQIPDLQNYCNNQICI